jgi:hypothetical protein
VKQKACVEYYLGIAVIPGVKVTLSSECGLLKIPLYTYDEFTEPRGTLRLESLGVMTG